MPASQPPPFQRYALYWAPPAGSPLHVFGRAWLGVDPLTGCPLPHVCPPGLAAAAVARITAAPRRYGLHATLKAPFRLAPGVTEASVAQRLARFAGRQRPFALRLQLAEEGRCLALVPERPPPALAWLAAQLVIGFDDCRAPLDASDRARRPLSRMSPQQRLCFELLGYPYVLSDFGFHITLTGPLAPDERAAVKAVLAPLVAPLTAAPLTVASLALFGDPGPDQPFRQIAEFPLTG